MGLTLRFEHYFFLASAGLSLQGVIIYLAVAFHKVNLHESLRDISFFCATSLMLLVYSYSRVIPRYYNYHWDRYTSSDSRNPNSESVKRERTEVHQALEHESIWLGLAFVNFLYIALYTALSFFFMWHIRGPRNLVNSQIWTSGATSLLAFIIGLH